MVTTPDNGSSGAGGRRRFGTCSYRKRMDGMHGVKREEELRARRKDCRKYKFGVEDQGQPWICIAVVAFRHPSAIK